MASYATPFSQAGTEWPARAPFVNEWYVYQPDGHHIGPVSTQLLARGIVAGKVPLDVWVGRSGDGCWQALTSIGEIEAAVAMLRAYAADQGS